MRSGSFQTDLNTLPPDLWLTQHQIAALFKLTHQDIGHHVRAVLSAGELSTTSVRYLPKAAADGKQYKTRHCSLDLVLAIARRLRWPAATQGAATFRQWLATNHPELSAAA